MDQELNAESVGQELGFEGVGSVVSKVEEYCAHEERRIALTNAPRILALRAEITLCKDEERDLEERLRHALPPGSLRSGRRKSAYYWTVTGILVVAAFVFSLLALDPYRLGWKGYLYCLGIGVVTPFLVEEAIERWNAEALMKTLVTVACLAALASLVFLAVIRGDILAHEVTTANPVVVSGDAEPAPVPEDDFYGKTLILLRLAMAFLAVAMEVGAGIALHKAWRVTGASGEDGNALRGELRTLREQMIALGAEITLLQNEPAVFVARFWRNFYRAMLTHTVRNAKTKLLLGLIFFALPLLSRHVAAEEHVTIIAAVDLTQSVAGTGPDAQTDFRKNIEGVTRLLTQVPASSRVVVLGITDQSFARPYILLSASTPDDPGYFGERLHAARREIVRVWKVRSGGLAPQFKYTDVLGALLVAQQLFDASPKTSRKVLVLFSDMRHHTQDLDLESGQTVQDFATLQVRLKIAVPRLTAVQVYAMGVDGAGKNTAYWQSLENFWQRYFGVAGAIVRRYTVLRELPVIADETPAR